MSANPKCARCKKTVYPTEKVDAGGSVCVVDRLVVASLAFALT